MILIGLFSVLYIEEPSQSSYFTFYFSLNLGIILVFSTSHFFMLFVAWELMVLTGYMLVLFPKTKESIEAGFKYLVIEASLISAQLRDMIKVMIILIICHF